MRTTYRMMGLADYITLINGLLGSAAILFVILAVTDLQEPYQDGIRSQYIWSAQLCILLSVIGDIIDGPIARRYSKRQLLGGSLDIMSDCISFGLAPAMIVFVLYGRMGEATPVWTFFLALGCCWIIVAAMLRLARFEHDEGSSYTYFFGLSSPANAIFLLSLSSLIWVQPSTGIGPGLSTWNCDVCFGGGINKPWFDFMILPALFLSGCLMISDRKMPKLKGGTQLWLSIVALLSLLIGTILQLRHTIVDFPELEEAAGISSLVLFGLTFCLAVVYFVLGPYLVENVNINEDE